jgi:hypothetical protein
MKLLDAIKVDPNEAEVSPGNVPPVPPSTQASQVPSQASMYPSFPNNYSNQFFEQPPYSEQYPSQTSTQQQPYQNYYPSQNYSQNNPQNNPGQYYPDQYNNTTPTAQSGYYPQQGSQNYNNQPYWSSNNTTTTYNNQDGQTNYNNSQQSTQNQNNYQQSNSQQASSTNYYPNSSNNYPNLMKSSTEQTFPLPARVPNENTSTFSNNFPQQQSSYPFTNAQQDNTTENTFPTFDALSDSPVEDSKVNDIKPDVVDTIKEEIKVEDKTDTEIENEVVKTTEDEIKIETNIVETKEEKEKIRSDNLTDVINEVARKPLAPGEIACESIRVPKSMLEMGTNAYRANREEPSIPYDWVSKVNKGVIKIFN